MQSENSNRFKIRLQYIKFTTNNKKIFVIFHFDDVFIMIILNLRIIDRCLSQTFGILQLER